MKAIKLFFVAFFMMLTATVANAQTKGDFFVGKWQVEVTGMPQGDASIILTLKRDENGKLTGTIDRGEDVPTAALTRVDEKAGKNITAYFKSKGYDCYLYLEKTGDDEVEGSMMDMFDAVGKKIKEEKKDN